MASHKESARSSQEVRGVRGIVQELHHLQESSSQQSSPICWRSGYEENHITDKPQSDNKTARKSTDPGLHEEARAAVESDIGIQSSSQLRALEETDCGHQRQEAEWEDPKHDHHQPFELRDPRAAKILGKGSRSAWTKQIE